MSVSEVLTILESGARLDKVKRALRQVDMTQLAPAFFARVVELSGQQPAACIRLAKRYDLLENRAYGLRAKAVGERAQGKWSQAADSFLAAGEQCTGSDCYIFSLGAIDSLARGGKPAQAVSYGTQAIAALESAGDLAMAARAHINVGNALAWQDLNSEAAMHYRAALEFLPEDALAERAMARLGLSTSELYSGNAEVARREAGQARIEFANLDLGYHAALARLNEAQANTMLGHADQAVVELLEVREELRDSAPDQQRISEFLGDAYLRLNLMEEAQSSFTAALAHRNRSEMPLNVANSHFGLGRAIAGREPITAARHFRYAARAYRRAENPVWEAAASAHDSWLRRDRGAAQRMQTAIHELRKHNAEFLAEEAETFAAEVGWVPLGTLPHSRLLQWRYHWLKAQQSEDKLPNYRRTFECIERDRLLVRSPAAAIHFLDDRGAAISEYLELLLTEPTAEFIAEAIAVLSRTRSVALIEEILTARANQLPIDAIEELDSLRTQLADDSAPGARFQATQTKPIVSREWTEKTWRMLEGTSEQSAPAPHDSEVWIETGKQIYQLVDGQVRTLPVSSADLKASLNWLEFLLFEPMINRVASFAKLEELIAVLRDRVSSIGGPICPDGAMWRIPWTLLTPDEPILQLNPTFGANAGAIKFETKPTVTIWIGNASDIPELETEIAAIREVFPDVCVLRSREGVRQSYDTHSDIIHVMGHARINHNSPMFSYLQFPDGPLYATEIAKSGISTHLAVVAACQTGTMRADRAYEPEGIVRSFLACGAAAAVGSLWPLDDEFSALFMKYFYTSLGNGQSLLESMRVARAAGKQLMPHPYFWGSMALFGGYTTP
ncbi:MAG: CHAT domain-containing protein [Fimbriimonadaceae bacterium]